MVGLLQGTLALTKRVERFQILHGALLLIGGVRRARPEFCRQAICSFPLHTFYNDSVDFSIGLSVSASGFIDLIKEVPIAESLSVNMVFSAVMLETLSTINADDSITFGVSSVSGLFLDTILELQTPPETITVSLALNLASTNLVENVVPNDAQESVAVSLGALAATLEDV